MSIKNFILVIGILLLSQNTWASETEDSIAIERFENEIDKEQLYIALNVKGADSSFLKRIDYFQENFAKKNYPLSSKRKHLANLYNFLHIIATSSEAKEKFKQGFYQEALDFFPSIIAYTESGELEKLLAAYPGKTLKSIPILFNEVALKNVLYEIAYNDPEVFYKYVYELFTLPYIRRYVEEVALFAPLTAKKYLFTSNYVNYYLESSKDSAVMKLFEVKNQVNAAAKSYILINDLVDGSMSIQEAEQLCQNKELLAKKLLFTLTEPDHLANYSINRELENLSIYTLRDFKMNGATSVNHLSPKELIYTMIYGNKELSEETIHALIKLSTIRRSEAISDEELKSISIKNVAAFINICEELGEEEFVSRTFTDEAKSYMMSKLNFEQEIKYSFKNNDLLNPPGSFIASADEQISIDEKAKTDEQIKSELANPDLAAKPDDVTAPKVDIIEKPKYNFPKIELSEVDRTFLQWTKNLNKSIKNLADIVEQENGISFLDYLSKYHPDDVFSNINDFYRKSFCGKYIAQAALCAPNSAKRYLYNPQNQVNIQLGASKQPAVRKLYDIFNKYAFQSKSYFLLNEIVRGNDNMESLHEGAKDKITFLKKLCKVSTSLEPLGSYSVSKELNFEALKIVREINGAENGGNAKYNVIEQLNAQEIYALMVYGQEELFKNSFNGIYNIFKTKLNGRNQIEFLESVNYHKFRNFLSLCSMFDKWSDFMYNLSSEQKQVLYQKLFADLEKESEYLNEAVKVADIMQNIKDIDGKSRLQELLKTQYEFAVTSNNQKAISVFGLLASINSELAIYDQKWYRAIGQAYKLPPLSSLFVKDLICSNGRIIEHCFFYDDDDGRSSYINFIAGYKNQADWAFEDFSTYVKISSRNGTPIEVYANKPEAEYVGQQAIVSLFKDLAVEPSIIIHRGHSYHTEKTIKQISNSPKFLFLGSCGGYYKIADALEKAPNAQTLATKQIGSKSVNDPVFRAFNEELRRGININWRNFWENMENRLGNNPLFFDYVPPHKNLGALFIRAYYYMVGV